MILRRPSQSCLCALFLLLVCATADSAEPKSHAATASAHETPPPPKATKPAASSTSSKAKVPAAGQVAATPPSAKPKQAAPASTPNPAAVKPARVHSDEEVPAPARAKSADKHDESHGTAASPTPEHTDGTGPTDINGLQNLGHTLTERGEYEAAEVAFRQIMASRKATGDNLAHALIGLARVHRRQNSLTKAAAIYERYLADYPSHDQAPAVLLELGRTYRALGASEMALGRFYSVINSTLKLSSEGFEHYQMLAKTAQFEIAETHFQEGNYAEADKFFGRLRLLELAPVDRARAHFKSAYSLYLGKDLDGAVLSLNSYIEQWPQDENMPEARYLLSLSLRELGRKQEALEATLKLLRNEQASADPKRWSYWQRRTGNQLANDFFQAGDTLNALVIYQGLTALSPEPAWRLPVTYQIGLCYERMRINDRARSAYQSIIDAIGSPAASTGAIESGKPAESAKAISPEMAELSRMATWRLSQLNWQEQTDRQVSALLSIPAAPPQKAPPSPYRVAPNLGSNAPSRPTTTPIHDQSGKPAKTPASL